MTRKGFFFLFKIEIEDCWSDKVLHAHKDTCTAIPTPAFSSKTYTDKIHVFFLVLRVELIVW